MKTIDELKKAMQQCSVYETPDGERLRILTPNDDPEVVVFWDQNGEDVIMEYSDITEENPKFYKLVPYEF